MTVTVLQLRSKAILVVFVVIILNAKASSFLIGNRVIAAKSVAAAASANFNGQVRPINSRNGLITVPPGGGHDSRVIRPHNAVASTTSDDQSVNEVSSNQQTIATATLNLIKGCVGSGVLSLPAGVAAIGDVPQAIIPACIILFTLGAVSAYTFHVIGRLVEVANTESASLIQTNASVATITSIGQLWDYEIGTNSSWLISLAIFLTCYGTCLAYSIILGDTFRSLTEAAGITGIFATRKVNVAAITLLGIYPLCNLKSLAALKPISIIGNIGIIITALFMTIRALPGGLYSKASNTAAFLETLPVEFHPSFGVVGLRSLRSILVISSMAATAFLVHMAAPEFYQTLQNTSVSRFRILSVLGFSSVVILSAYMMCVGFLTFGGACKGMILNNYSTFDPGAMFCRLLMGIALLGSYAFIGNAMKNSFYQIFYKGKDVTDTIKSKTTKLLVGTITALALIFHDAGFVVSFIGALLGSGLIYIAPPLLFLKSTKRRIDNGSLAFTPALKMERWTNRFLILLGVFLAFAGGSMTVINFFFPHLL